MIPLVIYVAGIFFLAGLAIGWGLGTWAEHRLWLKGMDRRSRP